MTVPYKDKKNKANYP